MTARTTQFFSRRSSAHLVVASIAAFSTCVAWMMARGQGLVYAVVLVLFFFLTAVVGWTFSGLLVLFLWMTSLVHLLKRAIFLFGPQSQTVYYSVLLLPTAILALLLLSAVKRLRIRAIPLSGRLLFAFVVLGVLNTLLSIPKLPLTVRLAAVHDRILPIAMFFVGLVVPLASTLFSRASRALVASAIITVFYGLFQFLQGPTFLDQIWAEATARYSLQAGKTMMVIAGKAQDWRAYSYFADPLTWGLFIVAASAAVMMLFQLGGERKRTFFAALTLLLGLFVCLTRTPWVGLIGMVAVYSLLRWPAWQRSWFLFGILVATFVIAIGFSRYLYANVLPNVEPLANPVLQRYTEIGTLEARIGAWDSLKEAVPRHWLLGTGFGYSSYYAGLADIDIGDLGGHNFLVELTVYTGLPGVLMFLAFVWALLREGTLSLRCDGDKKREEVMRLLLSFIVGYVATGYFNGGNFMNYYFFFFGGILAGHAQRCQMSIGEGRNSSGLRPTAGY